MNTAKHPHQSTADGDQDSVTPADPTAIDPICGMTVETANARFKSEYEGETYYFCSDSCRVAFNRNPAAALGH